MSATYADETGRIIPDEYLELAKTVSPTWPLARVAAALRDYDLDHTRTVPAIADAHRLPLWRLREYVRVAGLPHRTAVNVTRTVPDADLERTVRLVQRLGSQRRAAEALGVHQTTVSRRLDSAGHRSTRTTTRNA